MQVGKRSVRRNIRNTQTRINMSNIDFTKPVETVTGIPVQIISTSGREPYPVIGYVGERSLATQEWTAGGLYNARESESEYNLRNKDTQP